MKNLHMKVTWGAPHLVQDDDVQYGVRPSARGTWRVVMDFNTDEFGGMILEDEDGSALVWNDFVANEWVELYSSTPLALMRLAVLLDAVERDAMFENGDLDFAKNATVFMYTEARVGSDTGSAFTGKIP